MGMPWAWRMVCLGHPLGFSPAGEWVPDTPLFLCLWTTTTTTPLPVLPTTSLPDTPLFPCPARHPSPH